MARTPSTMLPLKTPFPHFRLPDPRGQVVDTRVILKDPGQAVIVMFICNHCPYVKHIARQISSVTRRMLQFPGVHVFAINSNDIERYPEDRPEKMLAEAAELGYSFPYLYDESQEVAKSFRAACTPEFYLFDGDLKLVYRGQFDDSRPQNHIEPSGADLWQAFEEVLAHRSPHDDQKPSIGCNIKWKPNQEPKYENFF